MHADYVPNPLYDNNPFIEALPPMLSGKDLIHALAVIPPYNDSDRDRSTGERLQLLSSLYEFYQPLSMTIDLYCEIYTAMQHCYGQYSPQSEAAAFQNGYSLMHGNALAASIGGGNSFSVVGVSGLGKSTALQRVLSLYPQVIEHTEYHGQKFYCHQIPYLVVQTPHDASIKALILDIYLQIDSLIGTCYQRDALSRRLSIDVLVSQLNQIVRVNHIGLLVIDELQNIAYRKSDGGMRFLNFLVHLINGAGVSICMVGTPRVLQVLQQEFRAARRTTGLVYDRLPNDKEFALLLQGLWHYQYTQYATDLTPEFANWLYRKTQGIPDILAKLLYNAQKQVILDGREKLDRDGSVYHAVLDSALRSRGWRSLTGGRTYATKIETALLNLYGSYIPTADLSTKQLHATLCSKSVAPRYVLQLAVLLGLSLHDLLHAPDAVPDYKAEMKAMYQSGASMYHIAQLYGIDAKTVARWIKS